MSINPYDAAADELAEQAVTLAAWRAAHPAGKWDSWPWLLLVCVGATLLVTVVAGLWTR